MKLLSLQIIFAFTLLIASCTVNETEPIAGEPTSSWEVIQSNILEPNYVVCHTAGTSFARESDLILTKDVAYNSLINKTPNNAVAAEDGLKLLESNGLESLYNSFLWEKIDAPNQEHFYDDHPAYGSIMPLGLPSLTNGELAYIKAWIIAGAPETGFVADISLLDDTDRFELPDNNFVALPLPTSGVQLHLGPFDVRPNFERELYQYQKLGNTEDIFVNRFEITMRQGSHHFILYDFAPGTVLPIENEIRDIRNENNQYNIPTLLSIQNQVFVFGTQLRNTDFSYPPGVALKIPAGKGFDLNTHYPNYSATTITGELYVNLHTIDPAQVEYEAKELFLNNLNFSLPPHQETMVTSEFIFRERRNIFMLTSHAHQQLKEFRIFIKGGPRDGELVYYTNNWEHPVLLDFDPPLVLEAGEGLSGEAIYDNQTDRTLQFGLLSTEEMMIIFGSYYLD